MSEIGTSPTSGDVRRESAKWAKADIDQIALSLSLPGRDRMVTTGRPPTLLRAARPIGGKRRSISDDSG
jgi:hypothetical protein